MGLSPVRQEVMARVAVRSAGAKRRRSQRLSLRIPVIAYTDQRRAHAHPGFNETTCVLRVSAYGGLLELAGGLQSGDHFMLRHVNRDEETECRVSYVTKTKSGARVAGFEFTHGLVDFWGVSFPAVRR